jgi:RNA polymerase sigma-70 factor (ECF subfamily)
MTSVPEVPDLSPGPEQRAMGIDVSEETGRLLEALSARYQEILLLRVVDGLSVLQTAQLVGATPGTVRVVQHRALARLRQAIARAPVQAEGGVSRYDRPQA